jgi:hypothetical protein
MKIFKIKHKETGLYSKGGQWPTWSKKGKTWNSLGHLKTHIQNVMDFRRTKLEEFAKWEIIEIEIQENVVGSYTALDIVNQKIEAEKQRQIKITAEKENTLRLKQQALAKLSAAEKRALQVDK